MKIKWTISDAMSVGSPTRAEPAIFGVVLNVLRPIQATFEAGEPLCDLGPPS